MLLNKLLWISLGCTAFACANDALPTQLEVSGRASARSAPKAYRILFVGDSITRHGANETTKQDLGWDHVAGMAASSRDKDYASLLAARIQSVLPDRKVEIYFDSQVTRRTDNGFKEGTFADKHARLQAIRGDFHPHLVVVQLGEHEQPERGTTFMQESCDKLLGSLKSLAPDGGVICAGVWAPGDKTKDHDSYANPWVAAVENTMRASCLKYGIPFASVKEFALDPTCRGWGTSAGVRWHPNDKGMTGYARVLFAAFGQALKAASAPVLPPASEVVLGGGIGAAYQLGVERLRQEPYDSVAFLRADLSQELKRLFINYSGDMSGRFIEVATLTATPPAYPPILKELLKTLPSPQPDGHFGAAVDWTQPLDKPDPLTAVKMPIFWGNSRLMVGLIEACEATREHRFLELARGIGDFYLATAGSLLDPGREAEYRSSGTYAAGYVTCYFPGIEGLVRLYRVTGEDKYLKQARRMADAFRAYDKLPVDHTHGNLLTQRALLLLYEMTGDRTYLEHVLGRWEEAMKGGYVWVSGGLGEHFQTGAGYDEGCVLADWLRLNLALWQLTAETKFLDAAERLLANQFVWNRFTNGGYGQLDFQGDNSGPFVLKPGHYWREATWCCSLHGPLGLHDLARSVVAGSPRGIFVNFPIDVVAKVRALDGNWRVTTESLPATGEERRLQITLERGEVVGRHARLLLRRPPWAAQVRIVDQRGGSMATEENGGYIRFDMTPGAPVTATFTVHPRLEDRRFGVPALDPSNVSRYAKIVLTSGPELLMANADKPPVVVVAAGSDGRIVLPRPFEGQRSLVTVTRLEAGSEEIASAIRSGARLNVGTWNTGDPSKPKAFVFDAIVVPAGSNLGRLLLTDNGGK